MKPDAVVLEKSSNDEVDINDQRIEVLRYFSERINNAETEINHDVDSIEEDDICDTSTTIPQKYRLSYNDSAKVVEESNAQRKVDRLSVVTGNQMIDQF